MKNTVLIVMLVISCLSCCCLVLVGVGTVVPKGFVDFPCFVTYDEQNQCLDLSGMPEEDLEDVRLQVYLTSHQIGMMGGGCLARDSESDQLHIETAAIDLDFERRGDALFVNGGSLPVGETSTYTSFWDSNPWIMHEVRFTNYGLVSICDTDLPARVVVVGTYVSTIALLKGGLVLLIPLALIATFTILLVSSLRKDQSEKKAAL
ncbi:MAG: hypothetical protein JXB85_10450 [Anaerolineales bacterium]|nr:hypothetical protein [Anaerolineales bacterium]